MHGLNYSFYISLFLSVFLVACGEAAKEKQTENEDDPTRSDSYDLSSVSRLSDSLFINLTDSAMLARATENDTVFSDSAYDELYWVQGILSEDGSKTGSGLNSSNDPKPPYNYFLPIDSGLTAQNLDLVFKQVQLEPALKNKYAGYSAKLKLLIGPGGKPRDYRVVSSPDFAITKTVVNKIRHLQYDPAYLDGKAVYRWVNVEYRI